MWEILPEWFENRLNAALLACLSPQVKVLINK
jgi:hypothetical protein